MWYNIINPKGKRVVSLNDKIKELIKLVEQLNKLALKVTELVGTITLIVLAVKTIVEQF